MEKQDKIDLFKKVVESNLNRFVNSTTSQAEVAAILDISKRDLTEDEIRWKAVEFFTAQLSKELHERVLRNFDK